MMMIEQSRRLASRLGIALFLLSLVGVGEASAQDARGQARQHYATGKALYQSGQYQEAIREFTAADRLAPSPILEFNIGLCYDQLGDHKEALRRYRTYLEQMPNARNRDAVEEKIARLEAALAAETTPTPTPTPTPAPRGAGSTVGKTGDPALDRVGAIDIGAIRQERGYGSAPAPAPAPAPAGTPPDPAAIGGAPTGAGGQTGAEGEVPPPPQTAGAPTTPPPAGQDQQPSKPIYKQWWFWVVVGVSAVIVGRIVYTAAKDNDDRPVNTQALFPELSGMTQMSTTGPVLFRF